MSDTPRSQSRLPQELYDEIIDHLSDHPPTLRSCALTCRSFVVKSQRHFFCNVALSTEPGHPEVQWYKSDIFSFADADRFRSILEGSPHLASYVLNLRITSNSHIQKRIDKNERAMHQSRKEKLEEDVTFCLRQLRSLRCLSIDTRQVSPTFTNPEFQNALKDAVALPSLICLDQSTLTELLFTQRRSLQYLSISSEGFSEYPSPGRGHNWCRVEFLHIRQAGFNAPSNLNHYLEQSLDIRNLKCLHIIAGTTWFSHSLIPDLLRVCSKNLEEFVFDLNYDGDSEMHPVVGFDFSLAELKCLRNLHIRSVTRETSSFLLQLVELLKSLPTGPINRLERLLIHTNCFRLKSTESLIEPWEVLWNLASDLDYFPCLTNLEFKGFFGMANEEKVLPNVVAWQTHFREKQYWSSRLKVRADILKFEEAFGSPDSFWPDKGFTRLLKRK
ncbi:hypothetical protein D9613_002451 [Agrocybe pediades]|uniref:F-box domain-containing protein n=1 Tax=Agrocybe pediades TaxID=84607 RepID=A0A8H4VNQ2_9AGAR|nr:hypothetical protein D9613_002451 [Agrocybe pediades]